MLLVDAGRNTLHGTLNQSDTMIAGHIRREPMMEGLAFWREAEVSFGSA
jgi:hypothetical protein